jgi:hypothetical protein
MNSEVDDDEDGSDGSDEDIDLKGDIKSVQSLVVSMMLVSDDLVARLQKLDKPGVSKTTIINDSIASTGTLIRLLSIATKKADRISRKSLLIEEENEELERAQESHAMALNTLESVIKTHKDDKKLLVPLSLNVKPYTASMSTKQGGDTKCSTCLENFKEGENLFVLRCNHYFHAECAIKWLSENRSACSLCKRHIVDYQIILKGRKRPRQSSKSGEEEEEDGGGEGGESGKGGEGGEGGEEVESDMISVLPVRIENEEEGEGEEGESSSVAIRR